MGELNIDPTSSSWLAIERVIREDIATLTEQVATSYIPHDQTENLRGQIEALRNLLRKAQPTATLDGVPLSYDVIRAPNHQS